MSSICYIIQMMNIPTIAKRYKRLLKYNAKKFVLIISMIILLIVLVLIRRNSHHLERTILRTSYTTKDCEHIYFYTIIFSKHVEIG